MVYCAFIASIVVTGILTALFPFKLDPGDQVTKVENSFDELLVSFQTGWLKIFDNLVLYGLSYKFSQPTPLGFSLSAQIDVKPVKLEGLSSAHRFEDIVTKPIKDGFVTSVRLVMHDVGLLTKASAAIMNYPAGLQLFLGAKDVVLAANLTFHQNVVVPTVVAQVQQIRNFSVYFNQVNQATKIGPEVTKIMNKVLKARFLTIVQEKFREYLVAILSKIPWNKYLLYYCDQIESEIQTIFTLTGLHDCNSTEYKDTLVEKMMVKMVNAMQKSEEKRKPTKESPTHV